ncbi:MAG TPA: DUF748 domain-containing protein [Flavobacteriales bacterium]|nr:DUF748 domain-containing protein [Flavobacteriales bacterium]HMR26573.1 DUF748 domain-containing protein [Flavobacteriales bacterium]
MRRRFRWWWTGGLGVLLFLLFVLTGALDRWSSAQARKLLVAALSEGGHVVDERALVVRAHLLRGRLDVKDLLVRTDSAEAVARGQHMLLSLAVPEFGMRLRPLALLSGDLRLEDVHFAGARVALVDRGDVAPRKQAGFLQMLRDLRGGLAGYLHSIGLEDLRISDGTVTYAVQGAADGRALELAGVELEVRGLQVDTAVLADPLHIPLEEFHLAFRDQRFHTPDGRSAYRMDHFAISLQGDSLAIDGLEVTTRSADGQGRGVQARVDRLALHGLDHEGLREDDTLELRRLEVDRPQVQAAFQVPHGGHHDPEQPLRLDPALLALLPHLQVDTFVLRDGRLDLAGDTTLELHVDRVDAEVIGFSAGPDTVTGRFRYHAPTDGRVRMDGLAFRSRSVQVLGGHVDLDIASRSLRMDSVYYDSPVLPEPVSMGHLRLLDLDIPAWTQQRSVRAGAVEVLELDLDARLRGHRGTKHRPRPAPGKARIPLPRLLAQAGIAALVLDRVELNGSAAVSGGDTRISVGNLRFRAIGVRCPEAPGEPHRDLYADGAVLYIEDLALATPATHGEVTARMIRARVPERNVHVEGLRWSGDTLHEGEVNITMFDLAGFDLPTLLEGGELRARHLELARTEATIELPAGNARPASGPRKGPPQFRLDTVSISDVKLLVHVGQAVELAVDSLDLRIIGLRPDREAFLRGEPSYLRDAERVAGRRLRLRTAAGLEASIDRFHIDPAEARSIAAGLRLQRKGPGPAMVLHLDSIVGRGYDPELLRTTSVVELGHLRLHGARVAMSAGGAEGTSPPKAREQHRSPPRAGMAWGVHAASVDLDDGRFRQEGAGTFAGAFRMHAGELWLRQAEQGLSVTAGPSRIEAVGFRGAAADSAWATSMDSVRVTLDGLEWAGQGGPDLRGLRMETVGADLRLARAGTVLDAARIALDADKGSIDIRDLHFAPLADQGAHAGAGPYRKDAILLDVPWVKVRGLDLHAALRERRYRVRSVELVDPLLDDLRDHRLPRPPFRYKPLPPTMLDSLQAHLRVDSIRITGGRATYTEIHPTGPATIRFTALNAHITRIATPAAAAADTLSMEATGLLEDAGRFHLKVGFLPDAPRDDFRYRLHVGPMDLRTLNPMLAHAAQVKVVKGRLDTLRITSEANDDVAIGELHLAHRGLRLWVLPRGHDHGTDPLAALETSIAEALLLADGVLGARKRPSAIYQERYKDRSLLNYIYKQSIAALPGSMRLPGKKGKAKHSPEQELLRRLDHDVAP